MRLFQKPSTKVWYIDLREFGGGRVSTKTTSKARAKLVGERLWQEARDRKELGVRAAVTLRELSAKYLAAKRNKPSFDSIEERVKRLFGEIMPDRHHLDPDMPAHKLTQAHLDELREEREAEGLATSTINREFQYLRAMLNLARRKMGHVLLPEGLHFDLPQEAQRHRELMAGEEAKLLLELDPKREIAGMAPYVKRVGTRIQDQLQDQYDLVIYLLDTGVRWKEATTTSWARVDTKNWQWIMVGRLKRGAPVDEPAPISSRLREVLQRRFAELGKDYYYVFPAWDKPGKRRMNEPRGHSTKGIKAAIERAGLNAPHLVEQFGKFTVHSLRHAFATAQLNTVENRATLIEVQNLLGHASPAMTQRYAKILARANVQRAAVRIDSRLAEVQEEMERLRRLKESLPEA